MPSVKIFFSYLFVRICVPFAVCLLACTIIWMMVDFYGNSGDFFEHKVSIAKILYFYILQIPSILVTVLPATMLFSTLWTLMALNRRSELIALQAGGMAPLWIFSPFLTFGFIWMFILAFDLNWPAAKAEVTRDRVLLQVKGQTAQRGVVSVLPYVDRINHRVWYFQDLDTARGTGKGPVEIYQADDDGHDMYKYCANSAAWTGQGWRLSGVKEFIYGVGDAEPKQGLHETLDLDIDTSPKELSLIISQPDQLSVSELADYISTSNDSPEQLAAYRTEWWYRVLYPLWLPILMLFALAQGMRSDRRNPAGGVLIAIVVLICFMSLTQIFIALGDHGRIPSFLGVATVQFIFAAVGLSWLGVTNGWWWQLNNYLKRLREEWELSDTSRLGDVSK